MQSHIDIDCGMCTHICTIDKSVLFIDNNNLMRVRSQKETGKELRENSHQLVSNPGQPML